MGAVRVAVDAMGGDRAPAVVVAGAVEAVVPGSLHVVLVGDEERIAAELPHGCPEGIEIRHAPDLIDMTDEPAAAVRSRPEASIVVTACSVREGWADAAVSAGSTGAMLAASLLSMRRIPGVIRPGLAAVLPGRHAPLTLIDAGANADSRPEHLLQFAHMGSIFASDVLHLDRPRVGLLTIGEEPGKGNELAREAYDLLATTSGIEFYGNVEGRDLLEGVVDVFVTDGFTGNVTLKTAEGVAKMMIQLVREAAMSSVRSKLGGYLLRPAVAGVRRRMDAETYGGAYLLGLTGVSVIAHGSSSSHAIANACRYAASGHSSGVCGHIASRLGRFGAVV
jgi:glycerol-3-phosphate acyltransferase PlsX